ncbi:hypothetical protein GGTG_02203 [Gaeumannomyces tritici R3-111a-1]|uniref:Uncharacterized protein n=1 Tax=Gaeumannomyces tritici (strain R3-111a-1) TaxID=644352 RepID=J3NLQ3_GAET3|nr:hypothetical protein GGTG_02203 [Gaeumannomyces tritici R3-111a-1]EJT82229.1 hypothetical protein GGTG_02203 [Gaeumannomyces tritici R3-111a-1]
MRIDASMKTPGLPRLIGMSIQTPAALSSAPSTPAPSKPRTSCHAVYPKILFSKNPKPLKMLFNQVTAILYLSVGFASAVDITLNADTSCRDTSLPKYTCRYIGTNKCCLRDSILVRSVYFKMNRKLQVRGHDTGRCDRVAIRRNGDPGHCMTGRYFTGAGWSNPTLRRRGVPEERDSEQCPVGNEECQGVVRPDLSPSPAPTMTSRA